MMEKAYKIITPGTGHSPHILANINDPSDTVALCSCGLTKDPDGKCDGSHSRKKAEVSVCEHCKKRKDRHN